MKTPNYTYNGEAIYCAKPVKQTMYHETEKPAIYILYVKLKYAWYNMCTTKKLQGKWKDLRRKIKG